MPAKKRSDKAREYEKEYPENGDNFTAGKPDTGALPNNPAKNAEKKAPGKKKGIGKHTSPPGKKT